MSLKQSEITYEGTNTMKAEQLTKTLDSIIAGEYGDIWLALPEVAGGEAWAGEIKDAAQSVQEYLADGEEYDREDLADYAYEYANTCCETYYKTIHDLAHSLDLWASNDIEQDLEDMGATGDTLTKWESLYLYSAMSITWRAVLEQAFTFAEELEGISA